LPKGKASLLTFECGGPVRFVAFFFSSLGAPRLQPEPAASVDPSRKELFLKEDAMSRIHKVLSVLLITWMAVFGLVTPAYAFDGRSGDKVVIAAGEVVNDDLYVGATELVLDGTVNGDVYAAGQTITINGTVNGNLIAAGQTVLVNGTVTGDVIVGASALSFSEKSVVGGDSIDASYSAEFRKGNKIGRDAIVAAGQILLAGDVIRNVKAATPALEIAGPVGGDVKAAVGEAGQVQAGPPPTMFMPTSNVVFPVVKPGLTIDPGASVGGNLDYTQNAELSFPAGSIHGKITRTLQPVQDKSVSRQETTAFKIGAWALKSVRALITLLLLGALLLWLEQGWLKALSERLRSAPLPSLGWGVVAYAGFFFILLLTLFVAILGAVVFGLLTLGGISGAILWAGILTIGLLILGFALATSFLAKIVFGMTLGKWMLSSANSPLAEHRYWPMVIGVALTVVVIGVLTFPLIPGFLGWLLNFAIVLAGLGTLWLWGRERMIKKPITTA
jgi:hypothetical protein